ncbi:MAG: MFS transporter [Oscillospiraceae bacterium]|nr:MFS transporter [Oscillospiraceae bacterium]
MVHLLLIVIYISFISLGLPDALLGSAWPVIHLQFGAEVSAAGIITATISAFTVLSSLFSSKVIFKLGNGNVTAISTAMTALALFGFSISNSLAAMCLWAVPYGLGAGCIDASLNNYVAVNYASRHMSWLHCMWAIGAAAGPYIMGFVLANGMAWNTGYRTVGAVQLVLAIMLFMAIPLWKKTESKSADSSDVAKTAEKTQPLKLKEVVAIKGAKSVMVTFFCFCTVEQTALVWAASYFAVGHGLSAEKAALFGAACITGEMLGRFLTGFMTSRYSDVQLIRLGQGLIVAGAVIMLLPFGSFVVALGTFVAGLGIAPIYPCLMHMTPQNFGLDKSQAIMGVQTASACFGSCVAPPIFGFIAQHAGMLVLPLFMIIGTVVMYLAHEKLIQQRA